jgi:hypothetical protein
MSEPDIKLSGLSIWIRGRPLLDASNPWDANWLDLRATMQRGQTSVTTEGAILMTTDFARFRSQLTTLYDTLTGDAVLSGYEPNLNVTLSAGRLGGVGIRIEITPDQMGEFHRFEDGLDQSYLPALIASCDSVMSRFPIVGDMST